MTVPLRLFLLLAGMTAAQAQVAQAQDVTEGRALYDRYCAACHGPDGTGEGPLQRVLDVPPGDLSRLQRGTDGRFPLARVVRRIDGRDPLEAHGGEMPVYAGIFAGRSVPLGTDRGQTVRGSPRLADLVAYLRSLQN